uniref:ATP-dependent (S)-NAD(P)H-hydrate dehydratase n=1 Tax=Chenopodium quinoa TaxID=63459 RepID=A0A803MAV1_CHEQI
MLSGHGMSTRLTSLNAAKSSVSVFSAVLRRQQFLIRSLGGSPDQNCSVKMSVMEADAMKIIRRITPTLDLSRYKGQAGKIAVVGGCREYTGAPYFAAISALKIGADLSHVFCTKDAAPIIKCYSPELIVHPVLEESYNVKDEDKGIIANKVLSEVKKWMERFDCLVIGPGLGRDPFLLDCVSEIIKHARQLNVPLVIDGDGLFLVTNSLDLVSGYPFAVLTPNVNEYKRLVQKVLNCEVNEEESSAELLSLVKGIGGVTVLRKGNSDLICDGDAVCSVSIFGSPRRCGGQGDILSGSVAVYLSWARQCIKLAEGDLGIGTMNPALIGCVAGSALLRKAASIAFQNKKRATLTSDIIEFLGMRFHDTLQEHNDVRNAAAIADIVGIGKGCAIIDEHSRRHRRRRTRRKTVGYKTEVAAAELIGRRDSMVIRRESGNELDLSLIMSLFILILVHRVSASI